jgi:uncharacterized protein YbaR (Trm112 family)
MPIKKELLDILCCPVTKEPVEMLPADKLARLNDLIVTGSITTVDGKPVEAKIAEALITTDGKTIYRIDDDIPVMLVDMGIPTDQIADW